MPHCPFSLLPEQKTLPSSYNTAKCVPPNAIEAAGKCEEKKITLKIKVKDGILYIVSTNTYVEVKEGFKTTKADSDNHGYGLNNIRKAVADNGGECYVECEEGVFRITVLIPS